MSHHPHQQQHPSYESQFAAASYNNSSFQQPPPHPLSRSVGANTSNNNNQRYAQQQQQQHLQQQYAQAHQAMSSSLAAHSSTHSRSHSPALSPSFSPFHGPALAAQQQQQPQQQLQSQHQHQPQPSLSSSLRTSDLGASMRYPTAPSPFRTAAAAAPQQPNVQQPQQPFASSPSPSPSSASRSQAAHFAPLPAATAPISSNNGGSYDSRLHSLASSLLSRIISSVSGSSAPGAAIAGMDASFQTLARDETSHPFLVARLGELLAESLEIERGNQWNQVQEALAAKDSRLNQLLTEFASIQKQHALKESLLSEQSDLLRRELLALRDTSSREGNLASNMLPRLQSQVASLLQRDSDRGILLAQTAAQLQERDRSLESALGKFEEISEKYLQLKEVTVSLNERLMNQSGQVESSKNTATLRAQEAESKASQSTTKATQAVRQAEIELDKVRTEAALQAQISQSHTKDLEAQIGRLLESQERSTQESAFRLQTEKESLQKEWEHKLREQSLENQHAKERLEAELQQAIQRGQEKEKNHSTELRLRLDDLTTKLENVSHERKILTEQLAAERMAHEVESRTAMGVSSDSTSALQVSREELIRLQNTHEVTLKELEALRNKYAQMGNTFEAALADDETKFSTLLREQSTKLTNLKTRWSEDTLRHKHEIEVLEKRLREAEDTEAEVSRHIKSQGDTISSSSVREAELQRKLQAAQLESQAALANASRAENELRVGMDKAAMTTRELEKTLDKTILERESDQKRFAHELELRLIQAKQAHQMEKYAADREVSSLKQELAGARAAGDTALAAARVKMDEEKHSWMRETTLEFDRRLATVRAEAPSQATFEAQLTQAIDARTAELNKLYMSPQAHNQVLEAKTQALQFESQRTLHVARAEWEARSAEQAKLMEAKHALAIDSMRQKFQTEYAATMAQVKSGCREYEDELSSERRKRTEAENRAEELTRNTKEALVASGRAERALEEEKVARVQLAEHLDQSGRVIEKLKAVLVAERATLVESQAEQTRQATALRTEATTNLESALRAQTQQHEIALENLRTKHAQDSSSLRGKFEQILKESSETHRSEIASLRANLDSITSKLSSELQASRTETQESQMKYNELSLASAGASQRSAIELDALRSKLASTKSGAVADLEALGHRHALEMDHARSESRAQLATLEAERSDNDALRQHVQSLQRQLGSVTNMKSTLMNMVGQLRHDHSALQHSIRGDLSGLYSVSTSSLGSMHEMLHDLRSRLVRESSDSLALRQQLDHLTQVLEDKESQLQELEGRFEEEVTTLRQQRLLDLQLAAGGQDATTQALRQEIEGLQARIEGMASLHSEQLRRIKAENEEEYRDQLKHMEDLLTFRAGAVIAGQLALFRGTEEEQQSAAASFAQMSASSPAATSSGTTMDASSSYRPEHSAREGRQQQQQQQHDTTFRDSSNPGAATPAAATPGTAAGGYRPDNSTNPGGAGIGAAAPRSSASSFKPSYPPLSLKGAYESSRPQRTAASSSLLAGGSVASESMDGSDNFNIFASRRNVANTGVSGANSSILASGGAESSPRLSATSTTGSNFSAAPASFHPSAYTSVATSAAPSLMAARYTQRQQDQQQQQQQPQQRGRELEHKSSSSASPPAIHDHDEYGALTASQLTSSSSSIASSSRRAVGSERKEDGDYSRSQQPQQLSQQPPQPAASPRQVVASHTRQVSSLLERVRQAMEEDAAVGSMISAASSTPTTPAAPIVASSASAAALNHSISSHASALDDLLENSFTQREYENLMRAGQLHQQSKQFRQEDAIQAQRTD